MKFRKFVNALTLFSVAVPMMTLPMQGHAARYDDCCEEEVECCEQPRCCGGGFGWGSIAGGILGGAAAGALTGWAASSGRRGHQGDPGINGTNGTNGINGTNGTNAIVLDPLATTNVVFTITATATAAIPGSAVTAYVVTPEGRIVIGTTIAGGLVIGGNTFTVSVPPPIYSGEFSIVLDFASGAILASAINVQTSVATRFGTNVVDGIYVTLATLTTPFSVTVGEFYYPLPAATPIP